MGVKVSAVVGRCREPTEDVEQRCICGDLQIEIIQAMYKYSGAADQGRGSKNISPSLLAAAKARQSTAVERDNEPNNA